MYTYGKSRKKNLYISDYNTKNKNFVVAEKNYVMTKNQGIIVDGLMHPP